VTEHRHSNDSPMTVQCYAGYKGEQRPQRFSLAECWLEVAEILKEWREPDAVFFRVRADDGNTYVLRNEKEAPEDEWTVQFIRG